MDFINIAIEFLQENWAEIAAAVAGAWGLWETIKNLMLKARIKLAEKQEQQTATLAETVTKIASNVKALSEAYNILTANAKIAKSAKEASQNALKGFVTVSAIPEDKPLETISATEKVKENNKSISDILAGL